MSKYDMIAEINPAAKTTKTPSTGYLTILTCETYPLYGIIITLLMFFLIKNYLFLRDMKLIMP